MKTLASKLPVDVLDFLTHNFKSAIKKVKKFSSGMINESYLITFFDNSNIVLRIYNADKKSKDVELEIRVMEKLQQKGIPVPKIIPFSTKKYFVHKNNNQKNIVVCMEFKEGHELTANEHDLIPACAHIHARMHKTLVLKNRSTLQKKASINQIKKWMDKEVTQALAHEKLNIITGQKIQSIHNVLSAMWNKNSAQFLTLPFGLVHFDYDSSNILIKDKAVTGVIDFDDITKSPFVVDLGFSLWWWLFFNFEKTDSRVMNDYIAAYETKRTLIKKEKELLRFFIRIRNMILLCLLFINYSKTIKTKEINKALRFDEFLVLSSSVITSL